MPRLCSWGDLPLGVRSHLVARMRERSISIADLNLLRLWVELQPIVPESDWFKDFGSFKICGSGPSIKTFLLRAHVGKGVEL